ncbi:MAG: hypothetical protein Q9169_007544 [Polycauliona sp. 2 TL-2023]
MYDEVGQYSRDTGDWLSIAEKAEWVNQVCVKERQMGGLHEVGELEAPVQLISRGTHLAAHTGSTNRLLILIYEPGSQQDLEIEEERRETGIATMRSIGIDFSTAWGNGDWGDASATDMESEASWHDRFAEFLNIDEGERHARARVDPAGASAVSRVGASYPNVKNLGDGWVLEYASIQAFSAVDRAAADLTELYGQVIEQVAAKIADGVPFSRELEFGAHGLVFALRSMDNISWPWVIRIVRAMSRIAAARLPFAYRGIVNSHYWDKAPILVVLFVAPRPMDG